MGRTFASPPATPRNARSPERPVPFRVSANYGQPHAAKPNPACSGLAALAADATVRCGHSSDSRLSASHEGGQATAEPSGRRRVLREPGRMKLFTRTPTWKATVTGRPSLRRGALHSHAWAGTSETASISRTSWRSNIAGLFTLSPRVTDRSPRVARHNRRSHGFLLRPSTAGGSGMRSWRFDYRESAAVRPSRSLTVFQVHRRTDGPEEITSVQHLPCRFGTFRSGHTFRLSTGGRARSNNEGQPIAAPSNPGMQRTRYARR